MKRLLLLSVCLLLAVAVSAQASFIGQTVTEQDGPVTVSAAVTSYSSTLDLVKINITGITGISQYISALEGVWTAVGGGIALNTAASQPDIGDPWNLYTVQGQDTAPAPQSWINETSDDNALSNGNPAYLGTSLGTDSNSGVPLFASFADGYFSTGTASMPRGTGSSSKTLFATLYVQDTVTSLSFGDEGVGPNGTFPSQVFIFNDTMARNEHFTIGAVALSTPEPSTMLLLASGLMGLLCYAWRKRK